MQREPEPRYARPAAPRLRFTAYAWAKLQFLRDLGDTEIGGFGITSAEDLLLVEDVQTVLQSTSAVTVAFDDQAVADFFEDQVALGRKPAQFARIWIHTHPGSSAQPSGTDEATLQRVFGQCDWSIMFILAKGGQTYCRLRFNAGPGGELEIPCGIDFAQYFEGADPVAWRAEYEQHVRSQADAFAWGAHGAWPNDEYRLPRSRRHHRRGRRIDSTLLTAEEQAEMNLLAAQEDIEEWEAALAELYAEQEVDRDFP